MKTVNGQVRIPESTAISFSVLVFLQLKSTQIRTEISPGITTKTTKPTIALQIRDHFKFTEILPDMVYE